MQIVDLPKMKNANTRVSLDSMPDGHPVVVRQIHCPSPSLRQRLMELGIQIETVIRKRNVAGGVICEVGHSRFALGHRICRQIEVALVP